MRTKLFFAFLLVILLVMTSSLIFEWLIMKDFDGYIKGVQEDHRYWVMASVEGSYEGGRWDTKALSEAVHWGMMLGLDLRVEDKDGRELMNSMAVMNSLSPAMKHRMETLIHTHSADSTFEKYPLYSRDKRIGELSLRVLSRGGPVREREAAFKQRGKNFLIIFFLIAGTGAVVMAVFLSLYLSKPLKRLRTAAEKLAEGDFSVRLEGKEAGGREGLLSGSYKDEIKSLSAGFNYMAEALQKAEDLRKHLMSNIAHEFRTPLAVMKAHAEAMIDGVIEDKPAGLENIKNEVEKLTRLVEGIEDLTKAEAGFFNEGEYGVINLREFLKGIEHSMGPVFHEKGLSFCVIDRGDVEVPADAEKLERIINNLVSNSLKYTDKGSLRIDYGAENRGFFIEVRDTGRGIPEDELPKIFTRFYRGRDASDTGAGIGLAIVKELVDIMKGRIGVHSMAGEGTAFRVWLPVK